tara:strand:+ start:229 stop:720 length:492 start_codon:yes stop_codon:yes gene_type:complete
MSTLASAVLGGVDGVVTSFAIAAGAFAGGLDARAVSVVGFSSLAADGLSMGASEYLSVSAERALRLKQEAPPPPPLVLPRRAGAVCFASFVACGAPVILLAVYASSLLVCTAVSLLELALLGMARACTSGEPLHVGLGQTVLLGAGAGGVAYGVGRLVEAAAA